jgi:hypothetical protein
MAGEILLHDIRAGPTVLSLFQQISESLIDEFIDLLTFSLCQSADR